MAIVAKVVCILVAFMVATTPAVEADITCDDVTYNLIYCLSYMKGGFFPTSGCCVGVRALYPVGQTSQDRHATCECLKSFVSSIRGLVEANAAALPGKCGVSIPYPISPKANCS